MSVYLIFALITITFAGILVFEGVVEKENVQASTIIVDKNGGGNYTSIKAAIQNAVNGDTIYVWDGTYYENNIIVDKEVKIIGNGTSSSKVNGSAAGDVFIVTAKNVTISGLHLSNAGYFSIGTLIKLENTQFCNISGNHFTDNSFFTLWLNNSHNNTVNNNSIYGLLSYGPQISRSNYNIFNNNSIEVYLTSFSMFYSTNNRFIANKMINSGISIRGELPQDFNSHTIPISNTVNNKPVYYWTFRNGGTIPPGAGEVILSNCENITIGDQNLGYGSTGIILSWSKNNYIFHNLIVDCSFGITLMNSSNNQIINNTINKNYMAIESKNSFYNVISNNSIWDNSDFGIRMFDSGFTIFTYNSFNNKGLTFHSCLNNTIHHNNFLNTGAVESPNSNSQWDNGAGEGNYWSQYGGFDDGSNGRTFGDGIGDTNLPYLGKDNYPFVRLKGWLYPGIPQLNDPGDVNLVGNYSIKWNLTARTIGYILEESIEDSFISPIEIYNGPELNFSITNKAIGKYYYRVKAYNSNFESIWSKSVDIIVDRYPVTPQNFQVSIYPKGNALNLSWTPVFDNIIEYEIYSNITGTWRSLASINHPHNTYNHTSLVDGKIYYYKLRLKNAKGYYSKFTEIINEIPIDSEQPSKPTGLIVTRISSISVDISWNSNTENDLAGYNIYRNEGSIPLDWGSPFNTTLKGQEEFIDDTVSEDSVYYYTVTAFDEVLNESTFSDSIQHNRMLI
jgi:parallel beta-helix repeat protein